MNNEAFKQVISDYAVYHQVLRIRDKNGDIVPFAFNSPQWRYHIFKQNLIAKSIPVRIIILKYRQGGFTTYEQGDSFMKAATKKNQEVLLVAHTEDSGKKIFKMTDRFYRYMDEDFRPNRDRGESSKRLHFPDLQSTLSLSWAGADTVGETINKVHITEFAIWKCTDPLSQLSKIEQTVPSLPGTEIVIESTPCGFNHFEEIYSNAKAGKSAYSVFFIRWFDDPQYQFPLEKNENLHPLSTDEEALLKNYYITPEQLKWRRWKISELHGDINKFWEQYPEDDLNCFLSTGTGFFDAKKIISRGLSFALANPPIEKLCDESLGLKIWEEPDGNLEYCLGADPSQGIGEDDSSMDIIERVSGRTILTLANNRLTPREFAFQIAKYRCMYNNAFTVVERNNHGHTVLSHLIYDHDIKRPYDLYHHEDYTNILRPKRYQINARKNKSNYKPGYPTQLATKSFLLNNMKDEIEENPEQLLDPEHFEQIKTFIRHPDGTLGAQPPKKDDRIISRALALWGRANGRPSQTYSQEYRVY